MGEYAVIYADPPWSFRTYSARGKGRSAEAYYDCMTAEEIAAMGTNILGYAAPDCVLLMWATDPFLETAFGVIRGWGFQYKTVGFYWVKRSAAGVDALGNGYWTRANPEVCLLATRGHPRRRAADVRKLLVAPRREHSRKPDEVYERVERLLPGPYLEVFARTRRPGWTAIGLEADTGPAARRWRSDGGPAA